MNVMQQVIGPYTKPIISLCVFAFLVVGALTMHFDPSHPKLLTQECLETTVVCVNKLHWAAVSSFGQFAQTHFVTSIFALLSVQFSVLLRVATVYSILFFIVPPLMLLMRRGILAAKNIPHIAY